GMTKPSPAVSGPYTHENLTIFLFHGPDQVDGSRYLSLQEALEKKQVLVHETGTVGQLEAENISDTADIFIQAGDVLKGGRQDRTIGIDFIIPARSGRVQVPAFCVESGRWHKRHKEDSAGFSASSHSLHSKAMRMAAKFKHDQGAVWESVAESQETLGSALNKSVQMAASPTSYQLSVEDADLQKRRIQYEEKLGGAVKKGAEAVGYAFYVNGERNSADLYPSTELFHKLWDKLLDVAILEAISARNGKAAVPQEANVKEWLNEAGKAKLRENKEAPPRTLVATKEYKTGVVFETFDELTGHKLVLHTNVISR
ncbi:MAG: hypothetical protein H0U23_17340, partial [Blastocatellia bacterium]|nr:hypothetical protein [Blastocatellia bacterium]